MAQSAYLRRLSGALPFYLFILLLEMLLSIHLLAEAPFAHLGLVACLPFFAKCTFRSVLWATLAWLIVALPRSKRFGTVLTLLFGFFFVALHLLESYLLTQQGVGYSYSIAAILAATTPQESSEYLSTAFSLKAFVRPLLEILLTALFCYGLGRLGKVRSAVGGRSRFSLSVLLLSLLISAANLFYFIPATYERVTFVGAPLDYTISPVDRILWNTYACYRENRIIQENMDKIKHLDLGQLEDPQPYGKINVVVIIGESLRRDYMHCYGYPLENTPRLDSLIAGGELYPFRRVISPATSTIESLTRVLTLQQVGSPKPWYQYPSLTSILSRCDYATYWVSNQEIVGLSIQPINTIANFTDEVTYIQARIQDADLGLSSKVGHDGEVLAQLHTVSGERKPRSVVQFVHLIGSHFDYDKRFPKEYARFSAKDIEALGTRGDKQVIADYVNSIYYNDHVVSEVIQRYSQEPTLLFYFSDHAEALYDDPAKPDFFGHYVNHPTNVEIPFLVYLSPSLRSQAPELVERIEASRSRAFVNDLFTHSLLDLLGIKTKYSDPKLEVFSAGYDTSRPLRAMGLGYVFDPYK